MGYAVLNIPGRAPKLLKLPGCWWRLREVPSFSEHPNLLTSVALPPLLFLYQSTTDCVDAHLLRAFPVRLEQAPLS